MLVSSKKVKATLPLLTGAQFDGQLPHTPVPFGAGTQATALAQVHQFPSQLPGSTGGSDGSGVPVTQHCLVSEGAVDVSHAFEPD